jgi:CRP-like cAMP-binding protein
MEGERGRTGSGIHRSLAGALATAQSATVTARDECLLYALDRESFLCAVSSHPSAANAARSLASIRLASVPVV